MQVLANKAGNCLANRMQTSVISEVLVEKLIAGLSEQSLVNLRKKVDFFTFHQCQHVQKRDYLWKISEF